jgi:hypothetical protein
MPNSFVTFTGNGSNRTFSFAGIDDYLSTGYLKVYVDGVLVNSTNYTVTATGGTETIEFTVGYGAPANGALVKIARETPNTSAGYAANIVDFSDGSVISAADLDKALKGLLHIIQEANDTGSGALGKTVDFLNWDADARRITNGADAVSSQDFVTKAQLEAATIWGGAVTLPQSWSLTGNGSQLSFTLSPEPSSTFAEMFIVEVGGVLQRPSTDYSITASAIVFAAGAAPGNGVGIRVRNFGVMRNALDAVPAAAVTTAYLADNAVTTAKIANDAVTNDKLAANSVNTSEIVNSAVVEAKLADDAVASAKIAANAVTEAKIANSSVTESKLASNSVSAAKVQDQSLAFAKLTASGFTSAGAANRLMSVDALGALSLQALGSLSLSLLAQPTADIPMNNKTFTGLLTANFTPRFLWGGNGVGVVYSSQYGNYIKIGRLVFFTISLTMTNMGASTGSAVIDTLPFPCASAGWSIIGIVPTTGFASLTGAPTAYLDPASNQIVLGQMSAAGNTALTKTNFTNTAAVLVSGCYIATT